MELIPLDDEEPILIEEKTKQEEKGVSLTKTNRRKKEPGENNKRGTTSVKKAMRERNEKNKPQDSKNKAQTTFEETRVDTRKQRRYLSQNRKNHN